MNLVMPDLYRFDVLSDSLIWYGIHYKPFLGHDLGQIIALWKFLRRFLIKPYCSLVLYQTFYLVEDNTKNPIPIESLCLEWLLPKVQTSYTLNLHTYYTLYAMLYILHVF